MLRIRMAFFVLFTSLILISCNQVKEKASEEEISNNVIVPTERINLWNGTDFTGLVRFIPDQSVDVDTVWSIKDNLIYCSGVPTGYLRTENDYSDYKLFLEWRWPSEVGNSGVLLHTSTPDTVWPISIEAQIKSSHAGDFYLMGGAEIAEQINKDSKLVAKKKDSSENAPGEWNKYEIICKGNTITLTVNGVLQNEATNTSESSGKICFQSEGKPIEFRNIYIEPIE